MKKLILLILLFPIAALAQKEIPKNANCIIIANNNTAYANFTDVRLRLTKDSIQIADLDKDLFQLKTGAIYLKGGSTAYFHFDCRDNKITVSGMWKSAGEGNIRIEDTGKPDSLTKAVFEKMKELAKKFGAKLTYEYSKYLP